MMREKLKISAWIRENENKSAWMRNWVPPPFGGLMEAESLKTLKLKTILKVLSFEIDLAY